MDTLDIESNAELEVVEVSTSQALELTEVSTEDELELEAQATIVDGVSKTYVDTQDTATLQSAKDYADAILPTKVAGKYLYTDGTTLSWQDSSGMSDAEHTMFDINLSCHKALVSDLTDFIFTDGTNILYLEV